MASSLKGIFDDPIKGFGLLYEYARKRANWATRLPLANTSVSKAHVMLRPQAEIFEDLTRGLAAMADRLLRKHLKKIIHKQFATRRMADVMIDLFVLAAVLSRVTASIDQRGSDKAAREIAIAQVFAGQVQGRATRNFRKIDDELIKSLADNAYDVAGYAWDVI